MPTQRALQSTLQSGCDFSQEFRFVRPDGEIRWLAEKARIYHDLAGKPSRLIGITYDITAHKLTEQKLHASMDELSVLMDTVPAIILIAHDPKCRVISCGRKARQLLRLPEGQKEFMPFWEREHFKIFRLMRNGRDLPPEELPLRVAALGHEVRNYELSVLFKDGATLELIGNAVPLFNNSGGVRGAIGAFVDITMLKNSQTDLEKARIDLESRVEQRTDELRRSLEALQGEMQERARALEELREKDQLLIQQSRLAAMGEMINNIAHQWRQPLNSIALIIQELPVMYRKGAFSGEYLNEMTDKAKNHVFNMSKTIEDFKTFFAPNREKVAFKVTDALAKALDLLKDGFKILDIEVQVTDADDPVIYGYANEFSQVLINLLLNCRDAFLEQKEAKPRIIKVRIFLQSDKTVITIRDNAGGIPGNIIDKIFDPYFTTKGPDKGTGIGLFMGKTIIERHMHGRLTVQNTEDGVEFRIELAAEPPDDESTSVAHPPLA
jgi:signal transduction histidine kinase